MLSFFLFLSLNFDYETSFLRLCNLEVKDRNDLTNLSKDLFLDKHIPLHAELNFKTYSMLRMWIFHVAHKYGDIGTTAVANVRY